MSDAAFAPQRVNLPELTVSELSSALKRTVEEAFSYVRVRGELGNVKYHSSGHIYLDIKDENACLAGVMWRSSAVKLKHKLEAGLEVVATGRITTFPGQSKYQIVIDSVAPAGVGALMALLEERKRKFTAEGLFDPARKQLLPFLPQVIGVITSPTGAVIRDILHRLSDRFPRRVLIWPVRVQGEECAAEVAAAIAGFNALPIGGAMPRPDVLIVARGGGSLEDLWGFNDERVVRAAAASHIPLISAVGHETDVTLIDHAADQRAPTPTAAAEMAVPVRAELLARLATLNERCATGRRRMIDDRRRELRAALRALPSAEALLGAARQRLDGAAERLPRALQTNAQIHHTHYARLSGRLTPALLRNRVERCTERLAALATLMQRATMVAEHRRAERLAVLTARLSAALRANRDAQAAKNARDRDRLTMLAKQGERLVRNVIERRASRLALLEGKLETLSYQSVLARGFALVRGPGRETLRTAASVTPGLKLDIEFADGRVAATALGAPTPKRRRTFVSPDQGKLFGD